MQMAETPRAAEINVTSGPTMRAVVRAVLLQVLEAVRHNHREMSKTDLPWGISDVETQIGKEFERWKGDDANEDTLAEWLYNRFAFGRRGARGWMEMEHEDRMFWEHEADAVRRAVGRGGFKRLENDNDLVEMAQDQTIGMRHNVAATYLRSRREQQMTHVPITDVMDILVGKKDFPRPPYNVEKAMCWCGGNVGPRTPGDNWGNGCLAFVAHDWTGNERG